MSTLESEAQIGDILTSSREALGVARARFYAMDPSGDLRLAACYGFGPRFGTEDVVKLGDPLVEWIQRHRKPVYANAPSEAGALGPAMERDNYARSLAAPIYSGSRLVGILELQDKLEGRLFGPADLRLAEEVAALIGSVLKDSGTAITAPEPLPLEDAEALFVPLAAARVEFPPPPPFFFPPSETPPTPPAAPPKPLAPPQPPAPPRLVASPAPDLTRRSVVLFKGFAQTLLLNPDLDAVVFSVWSDDRAELFVSSRRPFSEDARETLVRSLDSALASAVPGKKVPREKLFNSELPLGRAAGEIREFAGIQTSLVSGDRSPVLLTLVFARPPAAQSERALTETHRLVRAALLEVRSAERYRSSYRSLINLLLETGGKRYTQLKAHCLAVGAMTRRFATSLGLSPETVEQLTVAALLHDLGLRELELPYERLAGRRPLDLEELTIVRQHPVIGASMLERVEFPYSVAALVRHHHERFDGSGYPDHLTGERIPLGSRIIAIADAYDAMTAAHSYRAPMPCEAALETILAKGRTQFDPDLASRFAELLGSGGRPRSEKGVSGPGA